MKSVQAEHCIKKSARVDNLLKIFTKYKNTNCGGDIFYILMAFCNIKLCPQALLKISEPFNVDVKNGLSFIGSVDDMFGYTVQQFENEEGKWVLIGSPLEGQPTRRTGDVYKCAVNGQSKCTKVNLPESTTIANITEVKENMTMGSTLVTNPNGGFMACGPLYAYRCGSLHYTTGICSNVSSTFQVLNSIAPGVQECTTQLDLVIVLDGSNSVYPWFSVTEFLQKLFKKMTIHPTQTQVSIVQYGENVTHEFNLNTHSSTESVLRAASKIKQRGGSLTLTALGIDTARKEAFSEERGARRGVKKVMVVVTDGESHDNYRLPNVTGECERDGIETYAIAILGSYSRGNISTENLVNEILSIASKPKEKHFFNVSEELALSTIVESLGERIFALEESAEPHGSCMSTEASASYQRCADASYSPELYSSVPDALTPSPIITFILLTSTCSFMETNIIRNNISMLETKDKEMTQLSVVWRSSVVFHRIAATSEQQAVSFEMEMSQTGFSAHYSKDWVMLGAVGAYDWNGTVVMIKSNAIVTPGNNSFRTKTEEKNEPLAAYLGYTVSSASIHGEQIYIAGQPRHNHIGQVIIYQMDGHKINILQTLKGEQIGSYFGSVLTSVDVDDDSITDILLVGAPMYMGREKQEQGKVYVYRIDTKTFKLEMTLEPLNQTCKDDAMNEPCGARFGTAIASVKDLNLDGFNDVAIGAPLEGDHRGAVYIYHGNGKSIKKDYAQRIPSGGDGKKVKFFGQSIHGELDLNGDGLTDVTIGGVGGAALFWSRDVADVKVTPFFNPNVINMENKNCKMNNKETVCIFAKYCFEIIIKSRTNKQETFDLEYKITLDSHRFLSRSLLTDTNGRIVQGVIRQSRECVNHDFYMVEQPDFLNSVNVSVEFNFKYPEDGPVLSQESPNIVNAYIPFTMDCGAEKRCIADLVLAAQLMMGDKSFNQTVVKYNKDKFNVTVTLRNKWDSAYNPIVMMKYSPNIILAGIEDKPKVSCESDTDFSCKVGYPFLKRGESIAFTVTFQFNISHLLDTVSIYIDAVSDSEEKNFNDNRKNIIFPIKYESWLTFTGSKKEFHISIPANDSIPAVIDYMDAIGPEVHLNYMVKKNDYIPMPRVVFRLSFNYKTPDGNILLYLTNVSYSDNVNCDTDGLLDPFRINSGKIYPLEKFTESLKDTILDCKRNSCPAFYCTVEPSDITHINISMRVWKATFIKASIHSLNLVLSAVLKSDNSTLVLNPDSKNYETMVKLSKELEHGRVPIWVIPLSIIIGLLVLALIIFAMWKLGFFKRPLKKKMEE